jgi:hypothetical protein
VLPVSRLALGLYPDGCTLGQCQRPPPTWDESTGRAWAFGAAGVEEAWVWLLPVVNPAFFEPMLRWKTACAACAVGSCWEARRCPQHAPRHPRPPAGPPPSPGSGSAAADTSGPARADLRAEGEAGGGGGVAGWGGKEVWVAGAEAAGRPEPSSGAAGRPEPAVWWKARVGLWQYGTSST